MPRKRSKENILHKCYKQIRLSGFNLATGFFLCRKFAYKKNNAYLCHKIYNYITKRLFFDTRNKCVCST